MERLWDKVEPVVFISKDQFLIGLRDWSMDGVSVGGILAFITIQRGPEFHFHSLNTGLSPTRKQMCDFVGRIIEQYGYADTKTPRNDIRQHRFNKIFGFVKVGEDEYDIHYRIERLKCR